MAPPDPSLARGTPLRRRNGRGGQVRTRVPAQGPATGREAVTVVLRLNEHGPQRNIRLTAAQAALLTASKLVTVTPKPEGHWCVNADREMVGSVRLTSRGEAIDLVITPKLPVRRLFF